MSRITKPQTEVRKQLCLSFGRWAESSNNITGLPFIESQLLHAGNHAKLFIE